MVVDVSGKKYMMYKDKNDQWKFNRSVVPCETYEPIIKNDSNAEKEGQEY